MTAKGLQIPRQFKLKQKIFVYTSVTLTYGMVPSATLDYSSLPSSFKLNVSKPSFIVDVNLTNLNFFIQFQLQTTAYTVENKLLKNSMIYHNFLRFPTSLATADDSIINGLACLAKF